MTVVHNAQHWHVESNTHPPLKGLLHCGNLLGSTCDWPMALAKMRVSGSQLWIDMVARWYSSAPGAQVSVPVASLQSRSHWQPQREGSLTRSVGGGRRGGGRTEGRHGERVRVRCRDMVPRWYSAAPGAHVSVPVASLQSRSQWQPQQEGSLTRSGAVSVGRRGTGQSASWQNKSEGQRSGEMGGRCQVLGVESKCQWGTPGDGRCMIVWKPPKATGCTDQSANP